MASHPDRDLGEARSALDRGDSAAALKCLDRARRGYLRARDTDGLDHVLYMAALLDTSDDRARIARDNLAYAVKQNLRQESRRAAQQAREPWIDPYPDLEAPSEHTGIVLTRKVKLIIALGVVLALALMAVIILALALIEVERETVTLRLVNDTPESVTVRGCDDQDCVTTWFHEDVAAGLEVDAEVDRDDFVDLFKVGRPGPDRCLPVRVHDGYVQLEQPTDAALAVRLSEATPCPGTTVLPEVAEPAPL